MVNPNNKLTKDARVMGRFADIYGLFTSYTQHDVKESRSRRKKYRGALADELADIYQIAEAKKYLRAPDLRVRSK